MLPMEAPARPVTALVEVAPSQPLGDYDPSLLDPLVTPFVESLRAVYQEEAQRYLVRIEQVTLGSGGGANLIVGYATQEGATDTVAIDADLFASLFGVYLCDGWPAIMDIETSLLQQEGVPEAKLAGPHPTVDPVSAGTPEPDTNLWPRAYWFFIFTRNLLAALIRDSLIEIEQKAAAAMTVSLATAAATVDGSFTAFGIDPASGQRSQPNARLTAATAGLRDAVAVRRDLDDAVARLAQLAQQQELYSAQQSDQSGTPPPSTFNAATFTTQVQAETTALVAKLREWYAIASHQITINEPMALVLVEGLPVQFTEAEVGTRLGQVLTKLRSGITEATGAIHPQQSRVAQRLAALPGLDRAAPVPPADQRWRADVTVIDPDAVYDLVVPAKGPEVDVIESAMDVLDGDHGVLPLLHDQTWRTLVARGEIAVDSMTYVVHHQYLLALDRCVAEKERLAAQNATFLQFLSRASAVLSAAAFAGLVFAPTGVGAVAVGLLRGASLIADALVFVCTVHSVVDQLSKYDTAIASGLVAPNAVAMPGLAAVGSLMLVRKEYASGIAVELLSELMLQAVGSRWLVTKRLLETRGFLLDVKTVVDIFEHHQDGE